MLKLRFRTGSIDALQRTYEKYRDCLLTLAMATVNDAATAEDVVHDVFVAFAQSGSQFRLHGSLRVYLATCVVNRIRDLMRARKRQGMNVDEETCVESDFNPPDGRLLSDEQSRLVTRALAQLPDEQREVIARAGDGRKEELAPDRRDIRRFIMRMSTTQIAIAALVCIGAGAITAVGVNIGRYYYYGKNDAGDHIFLSEDRESFVTMNANSVTDVEQTRRDLEEMKILSQQGKKELLRVKETIIGTYRLKTHEYRYQLSDGRTKDMGEGADDMPVYNEEQWREFRAQLVMALS